MAQKTAQKLLLLLGLLLFRAVVCSKVVAAVVVCGDVVVDVVEYVGVVDIFDDGAVGGVVLGALVGLLVLVSSLNLSSRTLFRATDLFFIAFNFISNRGLSLVSLR